MINKLDKTFLSYHTLTAQELNLITAKIDEIINNIPTSSGGLQTGSITDEINSAKNWINGKIADLLEMIDSFEEGHTTIDGEDSFLDLFKGPNGKAALMYYGLVDEDGHPYFNILIDENGVKPAAIIAAITDNGVLKSQIGISADNVIIDADTTLTGKLTAMSGSFNSLTSGNGTFTGNVEATSFKVVDNNNPTIVFTTMSDNYRGSGYENLNASNILNGDPIGLIYDPQTHTPKYFFDFAPVASNGGTSYTLLLKTLTDRGGIPATIYGQNYNVYYNQAGVYYSDQAGSILANDNSGHCIIDPTVMLVYVITDEQNGPTYWLIIPAYKYTLVSFNNGTMTVSATEYLVTDDLYYLIPNGNNTKLTLYKTYASGDTYGCPNENNVYALKKSTTKTAFSGNFSYWDEENSNIINSDD